MLNACCICHQPPLLQKMPTIQLWHGGQQVAEVIGGGSAPEVVALVQEMITTGRSPHVPDEDADSSQH